MGEAVNAQEYIVSDFCVVLLALVHLRSELVVFSNMISFIFHSWM